MVNSRFLPISKKDLETLGISQLDVIIITGDAYVDHPSYGAAVIGRVLEDKGFSVGIIAQPDWRKPDDFLRLGRPKLFFGITAGNIDSILSNYTSSRRLRKQDDYSPGARPGLRPNRATIVYTNRVKQLFPDVPVVIGGIEASITRLAHYDHWSDEVRRSILLDAKADILVYGMGERQAVEIASRLKAGDDIRTLDDIRGSVVVRNNIEGFRDSVLVPSFEEAKKDKDKFSLAFKLFYNEQDPLRGRTIIQPHANRFVVQLPPAKPFLQKELDRIYELPYARRWHPVYDKEGGVPGFETVRFSIISNRGCLGECSFCSLYAHQGRIVQSRSPASVLREAKVIAAQKDFRGTITDIGGPTANLYLCDCPIWKKSGACKNRHCLLPKKCSNLTLGYEETVKLWRDILKIPGVKHLFIGSGMRYDLLADGYAKAYLEELCRNHISGQLKVAPEHVSDNVLEIMRKPGVKIYEEFVRRFEETNKRLNKKQFLVNYIISAHPGSTLDDALKLSLYLAKRHSHPEQVQDFMPLPMTIAGSIYYTGKDPFTAKEIYVPKSQKEKNMHRALAQYGEKKNKRLVAEALAVLGRLDLKNSLLKA